MAVYTPLVEEDVQALLESYAIGELRSFNGIAQGVENSNFLLETGNGKFILTLFEKRVLAEELPYFLGMMLHLNQRGIAAPKPVRDKTGYPVRLVKGKPAVIVTFLEGEGVDAPVASQFPQMGELMAHMHLAAEDFAGFRANALSLAGWATLAEKIGAAADDIEPGLAALIAEELKFLKKHWPKGLPSGPIHADLFPDNVFFKDGRINGVIDFYFACNEAWAYDLAVCINAWCFDKDTKFIAPFMDGMIAAYQRTRLLERAEKEALPVLLRGAALRFLLTRAHDMLFQSKNALVTPKDPLEYARKLRFFQRYAT